MIRENLIRTNFLFFLSCLCVLSCTQKEECVYSGERKDFMVFNQLKSIILKMDTIQIYDVADSSVVSFIFSITDRLKKPNQFGLIRECSNGLHFEQLSDSSFMLCVGEDDPIIDYSGGCYIFRRRENDRKYILSEVIKLE